jgi:hypothetical protein
MLLLEIIPWCLICSDFLLHASTPISLTLFAKTLPVFQGPPKAHSAFSNNTPIACALVLWSVPIALDLNIDYSSSVWSLLPC